MQIEKLNRIAKHCTNHRLGMVVACLCMFELIPYHPRMLNRLRPSANLPIVRSHHSLLELAAKQRMWLYLSYLWHSPKMVSFRLWSANLNKTTHSGSLWFSKLWLRSAIAIGFLVEQSTNTFAKWEHNRRIYRNDVLNFDEIASFGVCWRNHGRHFDAQHGKTFVFILSALPAHTSFPHSCVINFSMFADCRLSIFGLLQRKTPMWFNSSMVENKFAVCGEKKTKCLVYVHLLVE